MLFRRGKNAADDGGRASDDASGAGPDVDAPLFGATDALRRADSMADSANDTVGNAVSGVTPGAYARWRRAMSRKLRGADIAPDLSRQIGSRRWWRGMATMVGLGAVVIAGWPEFSPLAAASGMPEDDTVREEFRSQMIMPLALGGDSGRRMGPTLAVESLAYAPERPREDIAATLATGDSFGRMLRRAGVGADEADRVAGMISSRIALSEIQPGTVVDITLGRRPGRGQARPIEALAFRARFDLRIELERGERGLQLAAVPIRTDSTPLRIRGRVGDSLYRSARAAGAPSSAVQAYLRQLGTQMNLENGIGADDTFDLVVEYRRAATGETEIGELLYAGLERDGRPRAQLMRWGSEGRFFEASGVGEQRQGLLQPVAGRMSSPYGMRRHPILGYRRMHAGMDYAAPYGTPIVAPTDGTVSAAGRAGGCGNMVRIRHSGFDTRYCHMSRISVRSGQSVSRGQVIGYVGSTGLSTGPHLHYEMYRGGSAVNPASVRYVTRAQLTGRELAAFRSQLSRLKQIEPGSALISLAPDPASTAQPQREIDRLEARYRLD